MQSYRGFVVTVKHWIEKLPEDNYRDDGGNRWGVYALLSEDHPLYEQSLESDDALEASGFFHFGISLFEKTEGRKGYPCPYIRAGADYNHLGDERFTRYSTPEQACEVFEDARALYDWLAERATK